MKVNSKVAEMLNPWVKIYFSLSKQNTHTHTYTENYNYNANHHVCIFLLAGEPVIEISKKRSV
jgi:hypothetical protein